MDQQFNRDLRGNESRLRASSSLMGTCALLAAGTTALIGDAAGAANQISHPTFSGVIFRHDTDALRENRAQRLSQGLANFFNVIKWAICIRRSNPLIY
jgi:hypothetical protein